MYAVFLNHESHLLATIDIQVKAYHTAVRAFAITSYLQKNELLCLQPSTAGNTVNGKVVQITSRGRFQHVRIIVCNDALTIIDMYKRMMA